MPLPNANLFLNTYNVIEYQRGGTRFAGKLFGIATITPEGTRNATVHRCDVNTWPTAKWAANQAEREATKAPGRLLQGLLVVTRRVNLQSASVDTHTLGKHR